jgi:hypothetical protein
MSINKRTENHIEIGLMPMSGEIVKHCQYKNGIPSSYLSINMNYILPQDLDDLFKKINLEIKSVETDLNETIKFLNS